MDVMTWLKVNDVNEQLADIVHNVKAYGAYDDGTHPTETRQAIQAAIEAAGTKGKVLFPKPSVTYAIDDTLLLYSQAIYEGYNSTITMTGVDKPILASKNYYSGSGTSASGKMVVKGLSLVGDITKPNNHGIIVRDYMTIIEHVYVTNVGGDGIRLDHKDNLGVPTSYGSMVENRIISCLVTGAQGIPFNLGDDGNLKFTDGFVKDCIASSSANSPCHLFLGSAAGWRITGVHFYGSAPSVSMHLLNTYDTRVTDCYIEGWKDVAINCTKVQYALSFCNTQVKCPSANSGGKVFYFGKSSLVSRADINITNSNIVQENAVAITAIYADTGTLDIQAINNSYAGANSSYITKCYSPDMTRIKRIGDIVIDGKISESNNKIAQRYNDVSQAHCGKGVLSGNVAHSIQIQLSKLRNYNSICGTLSIWGVANNNGTARCTYVANVFVSAKVNGTNEWTVYTVDTFAPVGFTVNPTISATHSGNDLGYITVSFTPTSSDAKGSVNFVYTPSEV